MSSLLYFEEVMLTDMIKCRNAIAFKKISSCLCKSNVNLRSDTVHIIFPNLIIIIDKPNSRERMGVSL